MMIIQQVLREGLGFRVGATRMEIRPDGKKIMAKIAGNEVADSSLMKLIHRLLTGWDAF